MVVGLSSYLIYDKVFGDDNTKNNESDVIENNNMTHDNLSNVELDDNELVIEGIFGQNLYTGVGNFVVDRTGLVYYIPEKSWIRFGSEYKLNFSNEDKEKLGEYGIYQVEIDMYPSIDDNVKDSIEAFKLNLSNIKSVYEIEIGNGGSAISIMFLSNDGKVSELNFVGETPNKVSLKFKKNIDGYNNIVSIIQDGSYDGSGPIFIDKDGKEYR